MHMRAMTNSHVTWLIRVRADSFTCDKTHSYACHDYFTCVPWLIHTRAMTTWYVWHDLFVCVPWLLHVRDMTTSYAWHDLFVCVPWLLHVRDMTTSYAWHDLFVCMPWLLHMRDMTHSCVVMRDMTHSCVVKWRRMYDMMNSFVSVIYALRFECGVIPSHRYTWYDSWVYECIRQCVV